MLKELGRHLRLQAGEKSVLILILMEHAQRVLDSLYIDEDHPVLILILMEHAQRETYDYIKTICGVLS